VVRESHLAVGSHPHQYLLSPAQDMALAAEEGERSIAPTFEPEHRSASSHKRPAVEAPILVYHHIRQTVPVGSRAKRRLTVTVESFDYQMKYLQENGYQVVTFAALTDSLKEVGELPQNQSLSPLMTDGKTNLCTRAQRSRNIIIARRFLL
jgi:hypothetical protein